MKPLPQRMAEANRLLASCAVLHGSGEGRIFDESEDETRFPFQRDRDRIIHTQAFRRLKHKTQVFVAGSGDHYRTRLTHTMEVAQLSRDMARTLGLNEDLAECIALAHDLGHPPFAHAGEEELDRCLTPLGLHFEHNDQSLRTVTLLEDRCNAYTGLNLNREVLEGLQKHTTPWDRPQGSAKGPTLEAQVVNIADEVAYTAADVDDGLRAGLLTEEILTSSRLFHCAQTSAARRGTNVRGSLIHLLVLAAYGETDRRLAKDAIVTLDDVRRAQRPLVAFPADLAEDLRQLHVILQQHFYASTVIRRPSEDGMRAIRTLFDRYLAAPPPKVRALEDRTGDPLPRVIADYIAGMTDGYATAMAKSEASERRPTTRRTLTINHRKRKPRAHVSAGGRADRRAARRR